MTRLGRLSRTSTLAIALLLLIAIVTIAEITQNRQKDISSQIRASQERQLVLAELLSRLSDTESDERNLLLTGEDRYRERYRDARALIEPMLNRLGDLLTRGLPISDAQRNSFRHLRLLVGTKLGELSATLALYSSQGAEQAVALVRTDLDQTTMAQIRTEVAELNNAERSSVNDALERAERLRITSRSAMAAAAILNVALLILAAGLVARQARRDAGFNRRIIGEKRELEGRVRQRTAELSALSSHLQQLSEKEKASLARELHDELGGLLVAAKMDLVWLYKRVPIGDPDVLARWQRVLNALDEGVDFKRRVVESLRPTLLDNMGLFPAVRWITQETCGRAGLDYTEEYPEQEPRLLDDAAIMVFRLVQESLTNVVKHAHAVMVHVSLRIEGDDFIVVIEDDGRGIEPERLNALGSHGLATMRHRVRSFGGELEIDTPPTGGTRLRARLPLAALQQLTPPPPPLLAAAI
jgi:signal transduction histidine kinase